MKKPKTIRGILLLLLEVSDSSPIDYKGQEGLTDDEILAIGEFLAAMQNRLGDDLAGLLQKYSLEWKG